jgi:hypothetical protein
LNFLSGTIPDDLKIALVTAIFKANENNEFKNYWPILFSLVFLNYWKSLCINKRLINHIEKNKTKSVSSIGKRGSGAGGAGGALELHP